MVSLVSEPVTKYIYFVTLLNRHVVCFIKEQFQIDRVCLSVLQVHFWEVLLVLHEYLLFLLLVLLLKY